MKSSLDLLIDQLASGRWPDARPALDERPLDGPTGPAGDAPCGLDLGRFWAALARFDGANVESPRGGSPGRLDLYRALVQRHVGDGGIAFRWHDGRGWRDLTYVELDLRARRRAAAWAARGAAPGALVAIHVPFGVEAAVSLCAALYLGLRIAMVPPSGRLLDAHRLAALAPDFVVGPAPGAPGAGAPPALPLDDPPASPADSSAYGAADPVLAALAPLDDPPAGLAPVVLSAEAVWRGAVRDGLVVFALRRGDRLAAPGIDPARAHPALLFATLLRGATYLHVELAALAGDPALLATEPLRALILGAAARDLLVDPRAGVLRVEHWLRDPLERHDPAAWQAFVKRHALRATRHSNLVLDPASGGAILFALRPGGQTDAGVVPAWGLAWSLIDPARPTLGAPATGAAGLFALGKRPPAILLARGGDTFHIAGTATPRRAGSVIPLEVAAAAAAFARGASLVTLPGRDAIERDLVLLVFTGADRAAAADPAPAAAIRARIAADVGPAWLPDRIVLVPHHPRRRKDGAIDDAWCRDQFIGGALLEKARLPLFGLLTELRDATRAGGA